jgi:choline dehydrogenase-like flavoprotein
VHAEWARGGLRGLSASDLDPYYKKVEERIHVARTDPEVAGENAHVVERGAKKLGLSGGYLLRNAKGCAGSGRCPFGCPSGAKQSMERSYLPRASAAGARIFSRCRVDRILIKNGRAVGLQAHTLPLDPGRSRTITVRAKTVVLAGGSINTPILLKRNGLGGPAVGKHLHIHPAAKLVALMDAPVGGQGVPQSYYVDELHDEGVMLEGAYVPPEFAAVALPYFGARHRELMEQTDRLATFGMMVTDTSEGRVRMGLGGSPVMFYDLNQHDADAFKKGILLCARIFFAAGAKAVFPALPGFDRIESEAELSRLEATKIAPADLELIAFHPLGTCRIGLEPRSSVVDLDLAVHGIGGLLITDGSVIPGSIGVNPQLTIMALATRAAERVAAQVS